MGRPPKPEGEKRVQVNVRLLPADRDKLAERAEQNGRPLASEAEAIIAAALRIRPETQGLLDRIARKIDEMEAAAKGKWNKNLKAWAAVSQALTTILDTDNPEKPLHDDAIAEALSRKTDLQAERRYLVEQLANLGVAALAEPVQRRLGEERVRGLLGTASAGELISSRQHEGAAIDAMPDGPRKEQAKNLFRRVCDLDSEIDAASEEALEAYRPYYEAEEEGRRIGGKATGINALLRYGAMNNQED